MTLTLFATALALLAVVPAWAQGPKVDLIYLDAQPAIRGGCPAHVHFTGRIRTNGALAVTYQWLRSDGSHTEHTLDFRKPMTQGIVTDWVISKNYAGWMQLVILSPQRLQTRKAEFSVHCGR